MSTTFDYVKTSLTARKLVEKFGKKRIVQILKFSEDEQDPSKPWKGSSNPRLVPDFDVTTEAVFISPSSAVRLGILTIDDDLVKNSEKIMIIAPGQTITEDLRLADEVIDEAERWKVAGVSTLKPAEVVLLYYIGVKR